VWSLSASHRVETQAFWRDPAERSASDAAVAPAEGSAIGTVSNLVSLEAVAQILCLPPRRGVGSLLGCGLTSSSQARAVTCRTQALGTNGRQHAPAYGAMGRRRPRFP
jgi:hypothetical protein